MEMELRAVTAKDVPYLKDVLNTIDLFPAELLEEMMGDYLKNEAGENLWFTAVADGTPISLGYCAPEQLTSGTYNLYAIGVHNEKQGKGVGQAMMRYLEDVLTRRGERLLIVETSGGEDFSRTRQFYAQLGYDKEAVIRDFWAEGEDKVIFRKKLTP